jgi:hypothetical protein
MGMVKLSETTKYRLIDSLLDSYNENMALYELFADPCYKERAEYFINILKQHFKGSDPRRTVKC